MENRTEGIDRSEGVLRWVAVALAVALFVGTVACAGERAEARDSRRRHGIRIDPGAGAGSDAGAGRGVATGG